MADPIIKIHSLEYPDTVIKNIVFEIKIAARNDGVAGIGYVRIKDLRTNDWILYENDLPFEAGEIKQFTVQYSIPQTTPFIARTGYIKFGQPYNTDGRDFSITAVSPECGDYLNRAECEAVGCFWYYDGTDIKCHPTVICESIKDLADCERLDCYWYDGGCHSTSQEKVPWLLYAGIALAVAGGIGIIIKKWR